MCGGECGDVVGAAGSDGAGWDFVDAFCFIEAVGVGIL